MKIVTDTLKNLELALAEYILKNGVIAEYDSSNMNMHSSGCSGSCTGNCYGSCAVGCTGSCTKNPPQNPAN